MSEEIEIWKDVVGYEGRYQVSNFGQVRSLPNKRRFSMIILKQHQRKNRRFSIGLTSVGEDGKWYQRTYEVQWLVAAAFIGPRPEGLEVCHNDDNPANNHLSNLRYDTRLANVADRVKHDLANRGEKNGQAIFTENQVRKIKQQLAEGKRVTAIAREYGVCHGTISNIKNSRNWSHL